MKVGILTFQRAHNYGSILQAYALHKYISSLPGVECDIIDFSNDAQKNMYSVFSKITKPKRLIKNIITFISYPLFKREHDDFEKFIDNKLVLTTEKYRTSEEMKILDGKYDVFVAGSDQVWNIMCGDADDAYFLNFVSDSKKVAYAPSFGAKNISVYADNINKYINYLNSFSVISIREKNGQKWLEELLGFKPKLLIDPTMFFDKEEWFSLMAPSMYKKSYILYYSFHFSQEINRAVYKIGKRLGLSVVILSAGAWIYSACSLYGFKLARHSGPAEFLRLVNDAAIVLSNSFHGTVFSAIYEKNFWFLYGSVQDELDDRATTLVEQLKIEDRILRLENIDNNDFYKTIDYTKVHDNLMSLRKAAFQYLKTNISVKKTSEEYYE